MMTFDTELRDLINAPGYFYLATPYTLYPNGMEAAFIDACTVAAWLLRQGVSIYCPIAETHCIAKASGLDKADSNFWTEVDHPKLEAAHGVIVVRMPGWQSSHGIGHEITEARRLRKPVYFMDWPTDLPMAA